MSDRDYFNGHKDGLKEGREEILLELAKIDPVAVNDFGSTCLLCGVESTDVIAGVEHKPDCLYVQALAAEALKQAVKPLSVRRSHDRWT